MKITEKLGLPVRFHEEIEFVNIDLDQDTRLFLEPGLILRGKDLFSCSATRTINSFFDMFYDLYRHNRSFEEKYQLLSHCREPHPTKLGYGNGNNGKGRTPEGLIEVFRPLENIFANGVDLRYALDLPIFLDRFAEDYQSDMLTNILWQELNHFTLAQCRKYGLEDAFVRATQQECYFWNADCNDWMLLQEPHLVVDGKVILLVPKRWIRQCLYADTNHFVRWIVLDRLQRERTVFEQGKKIYKPSKEELKQELLQRFGSIRKIALRYVWKYPEDLRLYHRRLPAFYQNRWLPDEMLDCMTRLA